jgi:hypothetical protein
MRCYVEPVAYGYLRLTDERDDEEVRQLEGGLRKLAEAEGLWLIEIVAEYQTGYYGRFYELLEELRLVRSGSVPAQIGHVVVPSLDHLSAHPLIRVQLFRQLAHAGVRVWVVEPLLGSGLVSGE